MLKSQERDWLTTAAVARRLGVTEATVTGWARAGNIPFWRVGKKGQLRFDIKRLAQWQAEQKGETT